MNTLTVELPEHWTIRKRITYAILERTHHPAGKLTFHYRKGYQWRLHAFEGDVHAATMATLCTLMNYIGDQAWDAMEDSHDYGDDSDGS